MYRRSTSKITSIPSILAQSAISLPVMLFCPWTWEGLASLLAPRQRPRVEAADEGLRFVPLILSRELAGNQQLGRVYGLHRLGVKPGSFLGRHWALLVWQCEDKWME